MAVKEKLKKWLVFGVSQEETLSNMDRGLTKKVPGRQNKHHGRQPGSYKRKRDMIRRSRRANRS